MRLLADQRSLRGVPATLTWQPVDGIGSSTDPVTVLVTVTRDDGTALVTAAATSGTDSNPRTYSLGATYTQTLDLLHVSWKVSGTEVATTTCEIVGGYIAGISDIVKRQPKIGQTTNWEAPQIDGARAETEHEFEDACGVAFVPRYCSEIVTVPPHRGTDTLVLSWPELRTVRSAVIRHCGAVVETLGSAALAGIAQDRSGLAKRTDGGYWLGGSAVTISYEHGYDRPSPRVVRAFLARVWERLAQQNSAIGPRVISGNNPDTGSFTYAVPGRNQWITGNPDVDVVLIAEDQAHARYRMTTTYTSVIFDCWQAAVSAIASADLGMVQGQDVPIGVHFGWPDVPEVEHVTVLSILADIESQKYVTFGGESRGGKDEVFGIKVMIYSLAGFPTAAEAALRLQEMTAGVEAAVRSVKRPAVDGVLWWTIDSLDPTIAPQENVGWGAQAELVIAVHARI